MATPTIVDVKHVDALGDHAAAWEALVDASTRPMPSQTYTWLRALLDVDTAIADSDWRCRFAYDGDQLLGVMPLIPSRRRVFGVGRTAFGAHCRHVPDGAPLVRAGRETEALQALFEQAVSVDTGSFVDIGHFADDLPAFQAIQFGILPRAPVLVPWHWGSYVRIEGDAAVLSRRRRRALANSKNRLARDFPDAHRIRVLSGDDIDGGLFDSFVQLESAGWKGRVGGDMRSQPQKLAHQRAVVDGFRGTGRLEWLVLEVDGAYAAHLITARLGRTRSLLLTTYDERHSQYGPGALLFAHCVQREIELGSVAEVDLQSALEWSSLWPVQKYRYYRMYVAASDRATRSLIQADGMLWRTRFRARALASRLPGSRALLERRRRSRIPLGRTDAPDG